jgi:hypothetical protein
MEPLRCISDTAGELLRCMGLDLLDILCAEPRGKLCADQHWIHAALGDCWQLHWHKALWVQVIEAWP